MQIVPHPFKVKKLIKIVMIIILLLYLLPDNEYF